jgi:ABC-type glycerol-3-phosphate transport system permease component
LVNMSLKESIFIQTDFLGLTKLDYFANYTRAIKEVVRPVLNSLYVSGVVILVTSVLISLSGYAYGRMKFAGKEFFYNIVLLVMMLPAVMMIIPTYQIVNDFGWNGSHLALIMPYISGLQMFGIIISRAFYAGLPDDIFEAGKIDGASEFYLYLKIAMPLSIPVLITCAITNLIAIYSDYIWPTLVLQGHDTLATFCQVTFNSAGGNGATDMGKMAAFFVLGTLPLIIITASCMKYYLQGMLEGAVKS